MTTMNNRISIFERRKPLSHERESCQNGGLGVAAVLGIRGPSAAICDEFIQFKN